VAAIKAVQPVNPHHLTAKQLTADKSNLKKARAVAAQKPRSSKQKAASRANLVKARAAQNARRNGKKYVTKKQAQAPDGIGCGLYLLPSCAPVAIAAHLAAFTGVIAPADDILALHAKSSGRLTLAELLELLAVDDFAGMRLESFRRCDPDVTVPGWLYGLDTSLGYHAVLALPGAMTSWGRVLPLSGQPREAWHLEWAAALSWEPAARRTDRAPGLGFPERLCAPSLGMAAGAVRIAEQRQQGLQLLVRLRRRRHHPGLDPGRAVPALAQAQLRRAQMLAAGPARFQGPRDRDHPPAVPQAPPRASQ
jgi:hypothetical protein